MTTKFFNKDKFNYQKLNNQGEYETISTKERKEMTKQLKKVVNYPDNDIFLFVTKGLKEQFSDCSNFTFETVSGTMRLDYMSYRSNMTSVNCDAFCLNIHPRAKSLDITRVWVHPDLHGQGLGSALMESVMNQVLLYIREKKDFPKIILECCGSVGGGSNYQETRVEDQIRFFSKFGFEVDRIQGQYHHMVLTTDGLMKYVKSFRKDLVESN